MTDRSATANGSTLEESLLVQDLKPYEANQSDVFLSMFANNAGPFLSFFAFPIIGIMALIGRKRSSLMFNLTQAAVYQFIGIVITFVLWIIWSLIAGGILLLIWGGNPRPGDSQLSWLALLLGLIPALFATGWIAYATLYVADVDRLDKKTKGQFVYPRITDWLDKQVEQRKVRSLRKKGDSVGEATFMLAQGRRSLLQEKYEKALGYIHTAVQIYRSLGDRKREIEGLQFLLFAQSMAKKPVTVLETTHLLAQMHHEASNKEDYKKAIDLLIDITDKEKNNAELMDRLNVVIEGHPDDPIMLFSRANLLVSRQEFDRAYLDAVRAVEIRPEDPRLLFILGVILENQNRPEEAIDVLSRAIVVEPETAAYYRHRAMAYLEVNRLEEAESDTEQVVRLSARIASTRALQALLFLAKGEYMKAERYFQIAIGQQDVARWHFGLALAKLGVGDSDSAHGILSTNREKAQAIDLGFARRWLDRVARGSPVAIEKIQALQELLQSA